MISVQLSLQERPVVVVGGGAIAERRIGLCLAEGAQVTVWSPTVTPTIQSWAQEGRLVWEPKAYTGGPLPPAVLVLAVTDSPDCNAQVAAAARAQGAWVNRADCKEDCDITFPAVTTVGALQATISTKTSPRVNRLLRMDFSERYAPVSEALPALEAYREEVKRLLPTSQEREAFWQAHLTLPALRLIIEGHWDLVEENIQGAISSIRDQS